MAIPAIGDLLDLSHTLAAPLFEGKRYPWEILAELKDFIKALGASLPREEYDEIAPEVWVHKTAKIAPSALIQGPTVIGAGTEVRHCAFIRGSALIGESCVVGNSTEVKNAVIFDNVQVPHFNYVGDSVLGFRSHMGAGVIASNFRSDKGNVGVRDGDEKIETGLRKLGAILGDGVDVGCNSVLCPGSVVGRDTIVYPLSRVRGFIPERSILKGDGSIVPRKI
ncbi:MAG: UDP-N-acetylglucosamine pyrophosphorylase [Clostridia bacterium]|nr:UDP-N-acetylglucosamine pyrophosphorylase [Clostridia bacterium]